MRLGSYLGIIRSCIKKGWDDYMSLSIEHRMKHTTRSRASLVHDYIVYAARQSFDGIADARLVEINKLFMVTFGADIGLRFKKLDECFHSSGIPTQQRLDFMCQDDLPGIESVTHLEAGYSLNPLQTAIEGIYLCCPNHPSVLWYHELTEGDVSDNVIVLPTAPAPRYGVIIEPDVDEAESGDHENS